MSEVLELFGIATSDAHADWQSISTNQACPYIQGRCFKVRKSTPEISIGTCVVSYGKELMPLAICPARLLEKSQIFLDAIHLLSRHEPGNQLHIVPEFSLPTGSIDYVLASVRRGKVADFVGIELQTLDTTGTVWPARQRALQIHGIDIPTVDAESRKTLGINWKMTAKTILVQMHHKISTFEIINKHLLLVIQNKLFDYLAEEFDTSALEAPLFTNSFHIHTYAMDMHNAGQSLTLSQRFSTDARGVATLLGIKQSSNVTLEAFNQAIEAKISNATLLKIP